METKPNKILRERDGMPLRIKVISGIGIFVSIIYLSAGASNAGNSFAAILGLCCILLSIGLLRLKEMARRGAIVFSILFLIFFMIIVFYDFSSKHSWRGFATLMYFPLFVFSLLCLICLNQQNIKKIFVKKNDRDDSGVS